MSPAGAVHPFFQWLVVTTRRSHCAVGARAAAKRCIHVGPSAHASHDTIRWSYAREDGQYSDVVRTRRIFQRLVAIKIPQVRTTHTSTLGEKPGHQTARQSSASGGSANKLVTAQLILP